MKTNSIGFIGGGRVTRIILQAFANKGVTFDKICVTDINEAVTTKLKKQFPDIGISKPGEVAKQDILVIALHPPDIVDALEQIRPFVPKSTTVLSLAPKITIARIADILSGTKKICRLIPNATSFINRGYNPVCFSGGTGDEEKTSLLNLLDNLGTTIEVAEDKLEAFAIVSAMLPTYFWFQWQKMLELGIAMGLSESEALDAVEITLRASIDLMFDAGLSYNEMTDLVPLKPIGDHEQQINDIYQKKLLGLFDKIKTY